MSEKDIADLVYLETSRFDEREHLALLWVRATLTSPEGPPPELEKRFSDTFDKRERAHIMATMQAMCFSNLINNTLFGWIDRSRGASVDKQANACGV